MELFTGAGAALQPEKLRNTTSDRTGQRLRGYILPAALTVFVISAIAVALLLHSYSKGWDAAARNLVLRAASAMDRCARESGGSYDDCDADKLRKIDPGIGWRDGAATVGWGGGRSASVVYVDGIGGVAYRLQTTSRSGRVYSYSYSGGDVRRTTHTASSVPDWGEYQPSFW